MRNELIKTRFNYNGEYGIANCGLSGCERKKIFLAYSKNKKAWYLPGGKIDDGENYLEAAEREILEVFNVKLDTEYLKYYCHITAPTYGESANIIMEQDCFLYELTETIEPNNEIGEVKFFDIKMYQSESAQVLGVLKCLTN